MNEYGTSKEPKIKEPEYERLIEKILSEIRAFPESIEDKKASLMIIYNQLMAKYPEQVANFFIQKINERGLNPDSKQQLLDLIRNHG